MLRVTGHPGIRVAPPPFYSTTVSVKWVLYLDGSRTLRVSSVFGAPTQALEAVSQIFSLGLTASSVQILRHYINRAQKPLGPVKLEDKGVCGLLNFLSFDHILPLF
jgi:hypothetical protein